MPTKDGNKPNIHEINEAALELEKKVNTLIQEFKDTYNEPAVIMTEGGFYNVRLRTSLKWLEQQYQNSHEYNLKDQN